jgi:hypothetical protein
MASKFLLCFRFYHVNLCLQCCILYPWAGGPLLAAGSRMRWPNGLPMRSAVRRELVVLRRVVVNPHRLRNSSYLMHNFIWRVMMKWWLQVVRGCWRHKLLKDDSDPAGVRNKNRVHCVQDLPSKYTYMVTYNIHYRIQAGVHVQPATQLSELRTGRMLLWLVMLYWSHIWVTLTLFVLGYHKILSKQ